MILSAFIYNNPALPQDENKRTRYIEACKKATQHMDLIYPEGTYKEIFCPCAYDRTLESIEETYSEFSIKMLFLSAGEFPLSTQGLNSYRLQLLEIVTSRPDGEEAYNRVLEVLNSVTLICRKNAEAGSASKPQ